MLRLAYLVILVSCFFPGCASLQAVSPASDLLPDPGEFDPWTYSEKPVTYDSASLYSYIDGAADIFIEYGFKLVTTCELVFNDKYIVIEIYEMKDSLAAWGIYSAHKPVSTTPVSSIQFSYDTPFSVVFAKHKYYVLLKADEADKLLQTKCKQWAEIIAAKIPDNPPDLGRLFRCFPKPDLIEGSYQIAFGPLAVNRIHFFDDSNILNVKRNDPAVVARYKWNGRAYPVFFMEYTRDSQLSSVINALKKKAKDVSSVEVTAKSSNIIKLKQNDSIIYLVCRLRRMYIICGDPGVSGIKELAKEWQ
jgi:hypothetical protein